VAMTPEAAKALERTQVLYEQIAGRRRSVQKTEEYYRGKQPLRFASDKWAEYNASRYKDFSDNWCGPVANAPNERLRIDGFQLDDAPGTSDDEKGLWRDWTANDMEAQSSQGWLSTIIASRSYVQVWGTSDDEPVATWERADQFTIGYDPERPGVGVDQLKAWNDGTTEFATYATTTQVWKWQRPWLDIKDVSGGANPRANGFFETTSGLQVPVGDASKWVPRQPAEDDTWPIPNPMGILPGVEHPNRPMLGSEPLSDISGTMSMQDAINLLWAYLFNRADFASMPARVVMGQDPPMIPILDDTGQVVGERPVDMRKLIEDRLLWLSGTDTTVGEWSPAQLDVFTQVIETAVAHIAAQTRTPPNRMLLGKGMVNISADGMKAAETGLVDRVGEMQLFLTPPSRGIFRRFALVRGNEKLAEACRFGVVKWKDAEHHSDAQLADALLKDSQMGFPFAWIAEKRGLSPTEVTRVLKMREDEMEMDPVGMASRIVGQRAGAQPTEATPAEE
jgi:hypothetical protein